MSLRLEAEAFSAFCNRFDKEEVCIIALFEAKWPNGFHCPHCQHPSYYLISTRRLPLYECRSCKTQTSLIKETVMEGSRTSLRLWFQAIYLHSRSSSVNALQLSDLIGVTYKTAWLICHKIRHAMSRTDSAHLLTGIVRVTDGIYCKRITSTFDWHKQEQPILIGASNDEVGNIGYIKIKLQSKLPLRDKYDCPDTQPFLRNHVDPLATKNTIITRRYRRYGKPIDKTLVMESHHATWWIGRLFRGVGPKHLQAYLDQYCYLSNHGIEVVFNHLLDACSTTHTIIYSVLIGRSTTIRSLKRLRNSVRVSQQTG
ncbi:transposase [Cohnella sp. WQ 127256]|uniref:transposase n=1 Tax=Cohnella sp. WQ 127256 TaxID=2938790 RepID=UPI0021194DA9|nr:transposase [Cohnella sp. WQ 127256]